MLTFVKIVLLVVNLQLWVLALPHFSTYPIPPTQGFITATGALNDGYTNNETEATRTLVISNGCIPEFGTAGCVSANMAKSGRKRNGNGANAGNSSLLDRINETHDARDYDTSKRPTGAPPDMALAVTIADFKANGGASRYIISGI